MQKEKYVSLILFISCLTACNTELKKAENTSTLTPTPSEQRLKKLVWSDEFNTNSLNTSVWKYDLTDRNNEIQKYTENLKNVRVEGGSLVLETHKEPDGTVTSGSLISNMQLFSGDMRIDVRAKHPINPGSWPAAWLCGDINDWPQKGEIDIVENINGKKTVFNNVWYMDSSGAPQNVGNDSSPAVNTTPGDWHVYSVEREKNQIRFYLDGVLTYSYGIKNSDDAELLSPQYILLGTAYGGDWPNDDEPNWQQRVKQSDFPATHYVDYVRLYK